MDFTVAERLLADRLGFDVETIGRAAVQSVFERSRTESGARDVASYVERLTREPDTWQALVDRVVVPETWFFRDRAPFDLVAAFAASRLTLRAEPVHVLSCPCSTGEEAYSLAITLLEAGLPERLFAIDAVDVSGRALDAASRAVFRSRSFRGVPEGLRARYFSADDTARDHAPAWRLDPRVRALVRFSHGNVLEIDPRSLVARGPGSEAGPAAPYDVVFCRNLLIYLHDDARAQAMVRLRALLAPDGLLVVGHAESAIARQHGFTSTGPAGAFAFMPMPVTRPSPKPAPRPLRPLGAMGTPPASRMPVPSTIAEGPRVVSTLDDVRRAADQGDVAEAFHRCEAWLRENPTSAEGHFLLGVLHDARGDSDAAARAFRGALYLDPAHHGALLHLAVNREAVGDAPGAARLRTRAARAAGADTR